MSAWEGLDADVDRLVARLRPVGKRIGEEAKCGSLLAQRVIDNYTMLHRRIDPVAYQLTKDALDEWEKAISSPDQGIAQTRNGKC